MSLLWVAGGRDYTDIPTMSQVLKPFADDDWTLITGAARGADLTAETLWREWECPYIGVPAKWKKKRLAAGPERNQVIAAHYQPLLLIRFPGGKGTANAVKWAEHHGIEVLRPMLAWMEVRA